MLLPPPPASLVWPPMGLALLRPCCSLSLISRGTHAGREAATLRRPKIPNREAILDLHVEPYACLGLQPYAHASPQPPPLLAGVQHSGNDGRIELETLSAAELEEMVARHENGVGPMMIARLRQLQMGAKIREAHARRTAAN